MFTQSICSEGARLDQCKEVSFLQLNIVICRTKFIYYVSCPEFLRFKKSSALAMKKLSTAISHTLYQERMHCFYQVRQIEKCYSAMQISMKRFPFPHNVTACQHNKITKNDKTATINSFADFGNFFPTFLLLHAKVSFLAETAETF